MARIPDKRDAAALRSMARSPIFNVSVRAKIALAAAEGKSASEIAGRLGVVPATVRRWTERYRKGGVAGLADKPGRGRKRRVGGPPSAAADAATKATGGKAGKRRAQRGKDNAAPVAPATRGRPPDASGRIVMHVRTAAAAGRLRPNAVLPAKSWFAERFDCGKSSVQRAFAQLAREGFVVGRQRRETRMSPAMPFEGKYLVVFVQRKDDGLATAIREAAAGISAARPAVSFAFRRAPVPEAGPERIRGWWTGLAGEIAAQRWGGVFYWTLVQKRFSRFPPPTAIDNVPQSGFITDDMRGLGSDVVPLASHAHAGASATDMLFDECAARGIRRIAVFAPLVPTDETATPWTDDDLRAKAARHGMQIHPCGVQGVISWHPWCIENAARTLAFVGAQSGAEAYLCLIDGFVAPMAAALVDRLGAENAAKRLIVAQGNRPALPRVPVVPVVWHGLDMDSTLASFVDWCDAIHAGKRNPPPPALATF